jgi:hypothetical protein
MGICMVSLTKKGSVGLIDWGQAKVASWPPSTLRHGPEPDR